MLIRPCEVTLFWESVCFPKTDDFPPMISLWESLGWDRDTRLRVTVYNSLSPSHLSPLWLTELWRFSRGLIYNICEDLLPFLCFIDRQWSPTRPVSAKYLICWNLHHWDSALVIFRHQNSRLGWGKDHVLDRNTRFALYKHSFLLPQLSLHLCFWLGSGTNTLG